MSARRIIVLAAVLCGVAGIAWLWFRSAPQAAVGTGVSTGAPSFTAAAPKGVQQPESRREASAATEAGTPIGPASVAVSATRPIITDWKRAFDQGAGVVDAFLAAVRAAEAGDRRAISAVHRHILQCKPYFEAPHQPWMDGPGERRTGSIEQLQPDERCGQIARAPEFAADTPEEDKLTPEYWQRVAERVDEPLATSFRVAETLAQLANAPAGSRPQLKSAIAADAKHVLQSRDATAWYELGSRMMAVGVNADASYGIALMLAACDLGYDCAPTGDGGVTQTPQQRMKQILPADMYEQAMARYSDLRESMRAEDWAAVENFLPLDGAALR